MSILVNFSQWNGTTGASAQQIEQAFAPLHRPAPPEILELYMLSNGGEGYCGGTYMSFWPIGDLSRLNASYAIEKYMGATFIAIGSDGGGDCLGLLYDGTSQVPGLAFVPFGDLAPESLRIIGNTFSEGLVNCRSGTYVHPA